MKRGDVILLLWLLLGELVVTAGIEKGCDPNFSWWLKYTSENVAHHAVRLVKKGEWNPHILLVRSLLRVYGPVGDE